MAITITEGIQNTNTDQTVMMTLTSTYTLGTSPTTTAPSVKTTNKSVTAPQDLFNDASIVIVETGAQETDPQETTIYVSQAPTVAASLVGQVIITDPESIEYPSVTDPSSTFSTSYVSSTTTKHSVSTTSTQSSSSASSSSMEDLSSSLSGSGSSSLRLGLAIGLPVAIVSLFIILILAFIFLKKHKFKDVKQKMMPYGSEFFSYNKDSNRNDDEEKDDDASTIPTRGNYSANSPILNLQHQTRNANNRKSIGYKLRDRISRVMNFGDYNPEQEEDEINSYYQRQQQQQSQPSKSNFRNSIMSPMFLKRFNLSKPPPPVVLKNRQLSTDSTPIESKFVSYPYPEIVAGSNRSKPQHKRNYSIPPVVVPVSQDQSLDPTQGGISNSPQFKDKLYMVVKPYTKNLHDELTIKIGDKVVVLNEHSDGWCKVKMIRKGDDYYKNLASSDEGMIPKVCLQRI
ncbi:hypothetical protein DFJ63DRAFT_127226 [Scheffersomyces coipomensis]|uniref:uncharacterized protein n=1 Tax=Scheffersomyces coipomensis TaxID=1788519 RepID=UPI00315CA303